MTVLTEDTAPVIMTSGLGGDRYITPEYLAPLPQVYFFHIQNKVSEQTILRSNLNCMSQKRSYDLML